MSESTKNLGTDLGGIPYPQYYNESGDVYEVVKGSDNAPNMQITKPLPAGTNNIGDVDLASAIPAGTNEIGKVKVTDGTDDIAVNTDGSINTQLINRDTEESIIFNALAITDTSLHNGTPYDISEYNDLRLWVINTHDQPITLFGDIFIQGAFSTIADTSGNAISIVIPSGMVRTMILTSAEYKVLNARGNSGGTNFRLKASSAIAPTSGSITVVLTGGKN